MTPASDPSVDGQAFADVRPIVGRDHGNWPLWTGLVGIALLGLLLFVALDANRRAGFAPAVRARPSDLALAPPSVPPSLDIPPDEAPPTLSAHAVPPQTPSAVAAPQRLARQVLTQPIPVTPAFPVAPPPFSPVAPSPPEPIRSALAEPSSAIIVDGGVAVTQAEQPSPAVASPGGRADGVAVATRVAAVRSAERALVVPQGTLIGAVLETGLDSTQPGQARAIVSSDVRARRSTRVLIPKGSRLFGSYQGNLASGQNRVLVQWNRLVRPDGVTVAIDSPATDRVGRAGIKGRVNTHFFQRLGGALLQSAIDVGTILASRTSTNSAVIVNAPGRVSGVISDLIGPAPRPTISVQPGVRIGVFVVRDLDFSEVEARR